MTCVPCFVSVCRFVCGEFYCDMLQELERQSRAQPSQQDVVTHPRPPQAPLYSSSVMTNGSSPSLTADTSSQVVFLKHCSSLNTIHGSDPTVPLLKSCHGSPTALLLLTANFVDG